MNAARTSLRRILEAEASTVEVQPDALAGSGGRIAHAGHAGLRAAGCSCSPRRCRRAGGAVAAAVVLAGGGPPTVTPTPGPRRHDHRGADPATDRHGAAARHRSSGRPAGGTTADLAVYYVGMDRLKAETGAEIARPRLYREFHRLAAGDGGPAARTRAAVTAMFAGAPPATPTTPTRGRPAPGSGRSGSTATR